MEEIDLECCYLINVLKHEWVPIAGNGRYFGFEVIALSTPDFHYCYSFGVN